MYFLCRCIKQAISCFHCKQTRQKKKKSWKKCTNTGLVTPQPSIKFETNNVMSCQIFWKSGWANQKTLWVGERDLCPILLPQLLPLNRKIFQSEVTFSTRPSLIPYHRVILLFPPWYAVIFITVIFTYLGYLCTPSKIGALLKAWILCFAHYDLPTTHNNAWKEETL